MRKCVSGGVGVCVFSYACMSAFWGTDTQNLSFKYILLTSRGPSQTRLHSDDDDDSSPLEHDLFESPD